MRITKQIADDVAKKLTEKKSKELEELKSKLSDLVKKEYDKKIPTEVIELAKLYPSYFDFNRYVRLNGNGWSYKNIELKGTVISQNGSSHLEPDNKASLAIKSISDKVDDMNANISRLKTDVSNAIYNLRTYAKVSENFPEAISFLPKQQNTALQLNISDIKQRLK